MKHKLLETLGACDEGKQFAAKYKTLTAAWNACAEPAWMLWLLKRHGQWDKAQFVKVAVFAAEQVLPVFENRYPADERPRKAIQAAKVWIGSPSTRAAYAADAARDAAYAAYAAYAAADAADAARDAAYAAYAADAKIKECICDYIRETFGNPFPNE